MKARKLFVILAVICSLIQAICGQAEWHGFPFTVALHSQNSRCTGSLISRRAILTISDCLTASPTLVILGAADASFVDESTQVRFHVGAETYIHDPNSPLAIIRFSPQIAFFNNYINQVSIPFSTPNATYEDVDATVLGFLQEPVVPDAVYSWRTRTIRNQDCSTAHPDMENEHICVTDALHCIINSGSPLVFYNNGRFEQIGIVFRSNRCGGGNNRSIFLRITPFLHFIRANM
jgi:secreted trypsin-like serine protease